RRRRPQEQPEGKHRQQEVAAGDHERDAPTEQGSRATDTQFDEAERDDRRTGHMQPRGTGGGPCGRGPQDLAGAGDREQRARAEKGAGQRSSNIRTENHVRQTLRTRRSGRGDGPVARSHPRDDGCAVKTTAPVTHVELIAKNRRTSLVMLATEFLLIGILGAAIGILVSRSVPTGVLVGASIAIVVDALGWMLAVRATIALTHAVEVTPGQAKVLHDVVEGLCIRTGLPKPRVYILDDPAPNAFAFVRSPASSGVAVTTGLLNLMSRRELEGVLAHEMSHIRNHDVQVTTLAVTTVGILVA